MLDIANAVLVSQPALGWSATVTHSRSVAALVARFAPALGEDPLAAEAAGLVHDLGKSALPPALVQKPGPLKPWEWGWMRLHSNVGARMVSGYPQLAELAPVVRAVHERWDGGGYPDGLAGARIPRLARLLAACDAYVAMTEQRLYRVTCSHGAACEELLRGAGTHFDPDVIGALVPRLADTSTHVLAREA